MVHFEITESAVPSNRIFSVGESKQNLVSPKKQPVSSFNGIVTIGVLGEEAGLHRELRVARPARCSAKVR